MPKTESGLFEALERELKAAGDTPLDAIELFDRPSIRAHAATANRVSDYLGHLWRKGKLLRLPAPKNEGHRARWMYLWKKDRKPATPDISLAADPVKTLLSKPTLSITNEGEIIVINMPNLTITIKQHR